MISMLKSIGLVLFSFLFCFSTFAVAQDFEGTNLSSDTLPYGEPPFTYKGSQILSVTFKTSPGVLRAMVPEPLTPNPDSTMNVLVIDQHIIYPVEISYLEVILSVPVSYDGLAATYMPVLYLDKVIPIIGGREIWGFSKVDADIQMSIKDKTANATVVRNGTTLIDMKVQLGEPVVSIPEMSNNPSINLKLIPSVKKGAPPDVKQLTSTVTQNVQTHVLRNGSGKLVFGSLPSDPLGTIPVVEILGARYMEQDFVLDYGDVVFDYLRQGSE